MCIAGTGTVEVSGEDIHLEKWDIANIPSMQVYRHRNTGSDLFVRLTYTNTPLLEKLGVHYVEEDPSISTRLKQREEWHPQSSALDLDLGTGGARMRSYERSEEHTSELQSLMRSSYAVFCLKKKK